MNHGSLFSGIGGFDLAAEWMGWDNIFHCEWNEFGQKVLKHYWPKAISYEDITTTDFRPHRGKIDILTGGFPCQPYSHAGKRLGKEDDRHLWPEMLRAIREIQPRFVVGENVSGLLSWSDGLVFEEVQTDLENEGYEVQAVILPACSVNAPHKRDRVWFVAHSVNGRHKARREEEGKEDSLQKVGRQTMDSGEPDRTNISPITANARLQRSEKPKQQAVGGIKLHESRNATNTNGKLSQRRSGSERSEETKRHISASLCGDSWQNFPTQSPICSRNDGISSRLDGITFPKWRNESIKAGGNAIVPQVAYQIFKALE